MPTLDLRIENVYSDETITNHVTVTVPDPPAGAAFEDWAEEHIYPLTGTGRPGDAGYFVTVLESDSPVLAGARFEWYG